jgi:hypothetical protein
MKPFIPHQSFEHNGMIYHVADTLVHKQTKRLYKIMWDKDFGFSLYDIDLDVVEKIVDDTMELFTLRGIYET